LRIFGRKREEATGNWRKLRNEALNNMYSSPYIFTYFMVQDIL